MLTRFLQVYDHCPSYVSFTSMTCASLLAIAIALCTPSSPSVRVRDNQGPVICHHHPESSRRGILRTSGRTREEMVQPKGLRSRGRVFTWSVLLLVAVVDPHTFNSGDAYPLDPTQKDLICKRKLVLCFTEVSFTNPQSPRCFTPNIYPTLS